MKSDKERLRDLVELHWGHDTSVDSGLESLPADSPLPLLTSSIVTAPLLKLPPRVLPSLGKLCRLVDQVVVTCFFSLFTC